MDALFRSLLTSVSIKQGPYLPVAGDVRETPGYQRGRWSGRRGVAAPPCDPSQARFWASDRLLRQAASKAVRTVPSPLDQYVTLACTRSGQALRPVDGYSSGIRSRRRHVAERNQSVVAFQGRLLQGARGQAPQLGRGRFLAGRASQTARQTAVLRRPILRFSVSTSWGEEKEIYLLPPQDGAPKGTRTLGMECIHHCRPIETDPQFFVVVPDGEGH